MIDTDRIRRSIDIVATVGRYVELKRDGVEWKGLCPFHSERTASFSVSAVKQFVHCFGCGAHHDVIGFVARIEKLSFVEACGRLDGSVSHDEIRKSRIPVQSSNPLDLWVPIFPPENAPPIVTGQWHAIFNPKRGRPWRMRPDRADAYRDAQGRLLGYVLRVEIGGEKLTPTVTWCVDRAGEQRWCVHSFARPRPLCGLDDLARKADAPVLIVEGEKCRAVGTDMLPMYAIVTWPGGSKGVAHADFSPLAGRDVVLWPDADTPGRDAMLGFRNYSGRYIDGVAQCIARAKCKSIRFVDSGGMPAGWDIADAIEQGWSQKQIAAWAAARVKDVDVIVTVNRAA